MKNIVEILKDCPKGMELDCVLFEQPVKYMGLTEDETYKIIIQSSYNKFFYLTKEGYLYDMVDSKCIIFPKDKTTWEGFVPPCQFKEGEVLTAGDWIFIFNNFHTTGFPRCYCHYDLTLEEFKVDTNSYMAYRGDFYSATKEQQDLLFSKMKDAGYKWNAETKTLEKVVEPKFKVGDKIIRKHRKGKDYAEKVLKVEDNRYILCAMSMPIKCQDEWELFIDKFDINTLVPFQSKVLVRNCIPDKWKPAVYGFTDIKGQHCSVGGRFWKCLIPYENNEHLMGLTDDCDEYYKTWEE